MQTPEIESLKLKFEEISMLLQTCQVNEHGIVCDDWFEFLAVAKQSLLDEKIRDALNYSANKLLRISDKDPFMIQILSFFEGKTSREKKLNLVRFLEKHPSLKSAHPECILQRLRLINKYEDKFSHLNLTETPINDAITAEDEDLNNQEQQEEPQDEDFLQ